MQKSNQIESIIPSENSSDDFVNSQSISFSNLSIGSVKEFRASYENFDNLSKNDDLKTNLLVIKEYLNCYVKMADFIDSVIYEIWDKRNLKQIILEESHYNLIIFSLSALEINILEYVRKLVLGETPIINIDIQKKQVWNNFKYSIHYTQIKEDVENKIIKKKFCLKSTIETIMNPNDAFNNNPNTDENLNKLLKELKEEKIKSDKIINISVLTLAELLRSLFDQLEQNPQEITIMTLTKNIIMTFDLEKWFKTDPSFKKSPFQFKMVFEQREKEEEYGLKLFLSEFKLKQEEKALKEKLISFMKIIFKK